MTSLTSQDFDQSKFSSQKPRSNARGAHAKTFKNMALARPIAKSVRFSQSSDLLETLNTKHFKFNRYTSMRNYCKSALSHINIFIFKVALKKNVL